MPAARGHGEDALHWRQRARRGWVLLACAAGSAVLLLWVDQSLKRAPHAGFCPSNATLTASTTSMAGFLTALENSHAGQALEEGWPVPVQTVAREIRLATGIRPTARRVRIWLGEGGLLSSGPEGTGLSVRPGVALRAIHLFNRIWEGREAQGCFRYGPFYYDWRDGYLIVSQEPGYVRAARDGEPVRWPGNLAYDELHLAWKGEPEGELVLGGSTGLRITGSIAWPHTQQEEMLTLAAAWPQPPPLAMLAAAEPEQLITLAQRVQERLGPSLETYQPAWARVLLASTADVLETWPLDAIRATGPSQVEECAFALFAADDHHATRLDLAFIARKYAAASESHPLAALLTPEEARRYRWNGVEGVCQPWLGSRAMLCIASEERVWLAASSPLLMERLAGQRRDRPGVTANLVAELDWGSLATIARQWLRKAADLEMIPGINTRDVDEVLGPPLSVLGKLGRLQVAGRVRAGTLRLVGHLALPAETAR